MMIMALLHLLWTFTVFEEEAIVLRGIWKGRYCLGVSERRVGELIVRSNVQRHEFECSLFSDPDAFRAIRGISARTNFERPIEIRNEFETPEDINDRPELTPRKRLKELVECYGKIFDGNAIARATGVAKTREECQRFGEWLTWMERLGEY